MPAISQTRAMLWKDYRVLIPLVAVLSLVAVVLFTVVMFSPGDRAAVFYGMFLIFPNLLALGAPALLVGHEEESGTFAWQQTLPSRGLTVFWTKYFVAFSLTALVLLICGTGVGIAIGTNQISRWPGAMSAGGYESEALRAACFTWLLLNVSLFASWFFKQPAIGLVVVFPAMGGIVTLAHAAAYFMLEQQGFSSNIGSREVALASAGSYAVCAFLILLVTLCFALRRWRIRTTFLGEFGNMFGAKMPAAPSAYAPVLISLTAPRRVRSALLWQAFKQARWLFIGAALIVLSGVVTLPLTAFAQRTNEGWFILAVVVASWMMGVATFAGDTKSRRYFFLSQRGISNWTIWWTRMLLPVIAVMLLSCLLQVSMAWVGPRGLTSRDFFYQSCVLQLVVVWVPFATAAVSAMWASRPIVGFFGGPLLATLGCFCAAVVYGFYPEYLGTAVLAVGVTILTTLRMSAHWCEGRRDFGYRARFVGWSALALLAVVGPIAGYRWITAPGVMQNWRSTTFAAAKTLTLPEERNAIEHDWIDFRPRYDSTEMLRESSQTSLLAVVDQLQADPEAFVDMQRLNQFEQMLPVHLRSYRSKLDRGSSIRATYIALLTLAVNCIESVSRQPMLAIEERADRIELALARELKRDSEAVKPVLTDDERATFASALRTPEQRREHRRTALLVSWGLTNTPVELPIVPAPYRTNSIQERFAASGNVAPPSRLAFLGTGTVPSLGIEYTSAISSSFGVRSVLRAERVRAARFADQAVRLTLEQLESGLPSRGTAAYAERMHAWREADGTNQARDLWVQRTDWSTSEWTLQTEQEIERLRSQLTADAQSP